MNTKKFSEAMGEIDSKYIEKAINYQPRQKKHIWVKWGAIAACLAIMVYARTRLLTQETPGDKTELPTQEIPGDKTELSAQETPGDTTELPAQETPGDKAELPTQETPGEIDGLPVLSVAEHMGDGMGFEGLMAYDASELVNANPWSESLEISTLPVYRNPLTYYNYAFVLNPDYDKMREFLLEIADRFALDMDTLTITDDAIDEEKKQEINRLRRDPLPDQYFDPRTLIIEADGLKIEVAQTMTATIHFNPALSLPAEYNFMHYAPYEDMVSVAEYLKTEYKDIIGIDNPQINIDGGEYNIYAQQSYSIEFFDASGNDTQQIINYNFNRVHFASDSKGKLWIIRIFHPDLSKKVGDYPIITPEQAKELLANGNFITTVPYEMHGLEYVRKMELVYRTRETEEYFMPYYCFYVELPEAELENGLKTYGAFYVPAVEGKYISNIPTWDGSFN